MNKPEDVYLQIDYSLGGTTTWSTDRIDESDEHYILEEVLREAYTAIVNSYKSHLPELGLVLCKHCGRVTTEHHEDCIVPKALKWLEDNKE